MKPEVTMRACARVTLVLLMAVPATFDVAACGSIDDLRDAMSRWFDVGKSPGRPEGFFAPLAKHDHYDCAGKKIVEKQGIKDIKDVKEEGQASWQSATAAER